MRDIKPFISNSRIWIFFGTIGLILLRTISEPIRDHDPRFIWFFHGRMIFESLGLEKIAGWLNSFFHFSHLDYPLLFPFLSAISTHVSLEQWNDYFPKICIPLLVAPFLALLIGLTKTKKELLYVLFVIVFGFGNWIWYGKTDLYLGLGAFCSILLMQNAKKNLYQSFCLSIVIALLPCFKNEGMVLSGLLCLCAAYLNLYSKKNILWLTLFLPVFTWAGIKATWGINSEMIIGAEGLSRIISRLNIQSFMQIFNYLLIESHLYRSVILLGLTLILYKKSITLSRDLAVPLALSLSYFSIMFFVYLSTPYDLPWHLKFSADRTMIVPAWANLCFVYLIISSQNKVTNAT